MGCNTSNQQIHNPEQIKQQKNKQICFKQTTQIQVNAEKSPSIKGSQKNSPRINQVKDQMKSFQDKISNKEIIVQKQLQKEKEKNRSIINNQNNVKNSKIKDTSPSKFRSDGSNNNIHKDKKYTSPSKINLKVHEKTTTEEQSAINTRSNTFGVSKIMTQKIKHDEISEYQQQNKQVKELKEVKSSIKKNKKNQQKLNSLAKIYGFQ